MLFPRLLGLQEHTVQFLPIYTNMDNLFFLPPRTQKEVYQSTRALVKSYLFHRKLIFSSSLSFSSLSCSLSTFSEFKNCPKSDVFDCDVSQTSGENGITSGEDRKAASLVDGRSSHWLLFICKEKNK